MVWSEVSDTSIVCWDTQWSSHLHHSGIITIKYQPSDRITISVLFGLSRFASSCHIILVSRVLRFSLFLDNNTALRPTVTHLGSFNLLLFWISSDPSPDPSYGAMGSIRRMLGENRRPTRRSKSRSSQRSSRSHRSSRRRKVCIYVCGSLDNAHCSLLSNFLIRFTTRFLISLSRERVNCKAKFSLKIPKDSYFSRFTRWLLRWEFLCFKTTRATSRYQSLPHDAFSLSH